MNRNQIDQILDRQRVVAFPGVYDTLSAKICQRGG